MFKIETTEAGKSLVVQGGSLFWRIMRRDEADVSWEWSAGSSVAWNLQARVWCLDSVLSALGIFVKFVSQVFPFVLVYLGCYNNYHQLGGLNHKHLFLTVLESGSPSSRCWQIQVVSGLVRAHFLV